MAIQPHELLPEELIYYNMILVHRNARALQLGIKDNQITELKAQVDSITLEIAEADSLLALILLDSSGSDSDPWRGADGT